MATRRARSDDTLPLGGHSALPNNEHSPEEGSAKKVRRGRYSKACAECSRRKIKCDGFFPCGPCRSNRRNCNLAANDIRRRRPNEFICIPHIAEPIRSQEQERQQQPTTKELANRLSRIEHQLSLVLAALPQASQGMTGRIAEREGNIHPGDSDTLRYRTTIPTTIPPVQTFAGESSISHTLNQIEGYLEQRGVEHGQREHPPSRRDSTSSLTSLHTSTLSPLQGSSQISKVADAGKILMKHGVHPDRAQWNGYMKTFCEEVHILYPFLNLETAWANYTKMWDFGFSAPMGQSHVQVDHRIVIAQTWICVTLGKCTESPRVNSEEGKHSAGWDLFAAAVDLIGDLLGCFRNCSDPTLVLQTFTLMVVYLFRLDANERAEKFLALTVSHAHHLGFHRSKVVTKMPAVGDEMVRRLWWCLYAMDRRLALETGHPFLIQDMNVDIPEPRNLGDGWLTHHGEDTRTTAEIQTEIDTELSRESMTPIPYLSATIRYSHVVGKIWETLYGADVTDTFPSPALLQYLEQMIQGAQKEIQPEFSSHDPLEPHTSQPSICPWWREKQQMLMRIRWLSLRLLIRKSSVQQHIPPSKTKLDMLNNEITCIQIGCQVIQEFKQVVDEKTASAYPFLHTVVGCTVVSLGLILKEPSFRDDYGEITLQAAIALERYCHRTWVSGRMLRTICRLNQMALLVLSPRGIRGVRDNSANDLSASNSLAPYSPSRTLQTIGQPQTTPRLCLGIPGPHQRNASPTDSHINTIHSTNPASSILPSTTPDNLVMTDFDFEQSFINDIVPATHSHGYPDPPSEIYQGAIARTEMDWLESLFATDLPSHWSSG